MTRRVFVGHKYLRISTLVAGAMETESSFSRDPNTPSLTFTLIGWIDEKYLIKGTPLRVTFPDMFSLHRHIPLRVGGHPDFHHAAGKGSALHQQHHVNYLELQAVFLFLQKFEKVVINHSVLVNTDNTTVVAYINKMGGQNSQPCVTCCGA